MQGGYLDVMKFLPDVPQITQLVESIFKAEEAPEVLTIMSNLLLVSSHRYVKYHKKILIYVFKWQSWNQNCKQHQTQQSIGPRNNPSMVFNIDNWTT